MILINNLNFSLDTDFDNLKSIAAKELRLNANQVKSARLYRKSVDARRKNDVHFCCSVLAEVLGDEGKICKASKKACIYKNKPYVWLKADKTPEKRPVVVGFGPAGMFCALTLARAGLKPIVLERGSCVEKRVKAVEDYFSGKPLNSNCNVQFGEGGAGTFSDGKLTTGIKNPRLRTVLEVLHQKGAKENILVDAKPHIGTDILVDVVRNIRKEILSSGGEILFDTKVLRVNAVGESIVSVTTENGEIPCDNVVLATGHSARDIYEMLKGINTQMEQKPFAVGVRIEHLREDIDKALYGEFHNHSALSAADYKLACHLQNGRGVYTFCMCPGGEVINSSSEEKGLCVNGMSYSGRDGENSNSALLVGVDTADFGSEDVLAGCRLQEKIEASAFNVAKGRIPITTVGNFLNNNEFKLGKVKPTVKPQYAHCDFNEIFPEFVVSSLKEGIKQFGKKIAGFDNAEAVLSAPETRSSAPVRILRNEHFESLNFKGLYPCGEGAGYAGGIISSAVDGMTVAEEIIHQINID